MGIRLEKGRRTIAFALLWMGIAFGAQLYAGIWEGMAMMTALAMAAAFGVLAFASAVVRIELKSWWSVILGLGFAAAAGWFPMHWVLVIDHAVASRSLVNNTLLSMVLLLMGTAITGKPKGVAIFWLIFCFGFGMVETAVAQFRGGIIVLSDFLELGTALSVAGGYTLEIMPRMISAALAMVISVLAVARARMEWKRAGKMWYRMLCAALAALSAVIPVMQMDDLTVLTWGRQGAYKRGILMEFLLEAGDMFVSEPEGYSTEAAEMLAQEYETAKITGERPHVIAIMGEAFSDLQAVGDFETSEEVLPFVHSLYEESTHGLALASVFGGKTALSEWEFLTGNSSALLPAGAMPFRQYAQDGMNSLVETLENQGYQTVGMHCYLSGGWNRNTVYPQLGFDEVYFMDDLEWDETVRGLVSDGAFFRRIIDLFERREEGKPLFLFGVTMQNHGGYTEKIGIVETTVRAEGTSQEYPEADQYLSLLQRTDAALEELIKYFRNVDEKVIVMHFGDHMPQISGSFYNKAGIENGQKRYMVPWFIWKNYDDAETEIPLTSLNYLPAILLEEMGVDGPAYYDFLNEARKAIPAINVRGCMIDGVNVQLDALEGSALEMLENYRILQYANMFDDAASDAYFTGGAE